MNEQKENNPNNKPFISLAELFVVCIILFVGLALLLPATQRPRGHNFQGMCRNNLRQIILACHNYQSAYLRFPSGSSEPEEGIGTSFYIPILPFIEQQNTADDFATNLEARGFAFAISEASKVRIPTMFCLSGSDEDRLATAFPGDHGFTAHYLGSLGPNSDPDSIGYQFSFSDPSVPGNVPIGLQGVFSPESKNPADPTMRAHFSTQSGKTFDDITDGSSNTIAIFESSRSDDSASGFKKLSRSWAYGHSESDDGANIKYVFSARSTAHRINSNHGNWNDFPAGSNHGSGANHALVDGSTHFVNEKVSMEILRAMSGINDGVVTSFDD